MNPLIPLAILAALPLALALFLLALLVGACVLTINHVGLYGLRLRRSSSQMRSAP